MSSIHQKISNILRTPNLHIYFSSFSGCWIISNFVIFHQINVAKHNWDPCCQLVSETGSWFFKIWFILICHLTVSLSTAASGNTAPGSTKAKGREPKSCLSWVFNFKLGHFCFTAANVHSKHIAPFGVENLAQVLS